jgi:predicted Zn-dependent protease/SAM-dependent methyltransferase/sulfatase maturation enzyme AslB (radical SAM superfamily)
MTHYGSLRLFAQKRLFEIISDPARAARIKKLHGFDHMDFMEATQYGSIFVNGPAPVEAKAMNEPEAPPLEKGIQAFNAGDFLAALDHLSKAMTQEPENPLPPAYLAFIAVHQGLIPEARDFIARCERIAPERHDIKAAFGENLLKAGHAELAAEYLQAAINAQPDLLAAYPALAQSKNSSGRYEEAVSILESVAVIPSDAQAEIQSALLQILAEHGDWAGLARRHQRMYPGDAGYCPVCASANVRWLPLPDYYREQSERHGFRYFGRCEMTSPETYSCPVCGASDRERLYALFLGARRQDREQSGAGPEAMIHFAPEAALSRHIRQKRYFASYETADMNMPDVDHRVDLQALPFDDDSCDFFLCSHVLEHVPDDRKAIAELYRITRPGGGGLLMAPICFDMEKTLEDPSITSESERWRLFGQNDPVRLYSHDDYVARIEESGFSLRQMTRNDFGEEVFRLLGLEDTSILYVVSRFPLPPSEKIGDACHHGDEELACADPLSAAIRAFRDGNHEDALWFLEAAIGKDPANPLIHVYLALISIRAGRTREAWEFIDHALKLAEDGMEFLAALGEEFLNNGQPNEALRCLEPAIGRKPGLFSAYPALAEALRLTGRIDEAFDLLAGVANFDRGVLPAGLKEWIDGALPPLERQRRAAESTMQDGLLRVRITNKCNAKCRFCGIQSWDEKLRSTSLDKAMLYEYCKPLYEQIKILLLTGGDPLASEEGFEYARFLSRNYPRITIFIESNGIAFTEKWRQLAKDNLFTTHFSINASNAQVFEAGCWASPGGAAYVKALKHIESYIDVLRRDGLDVFAPDFSMVINKDTASDIRDFVRKALRMGARFTMFFFDYTENDMSAPYFGRPETSRPALEELMKLERVLAGRFFVYFRLWIPLREVELLQGKVDAIPSSDLEAEYADILALAQNRSMLREHRERQRIRAMRGKKIHTWDEDWTPTIRQTEIDGQKVCFAPFKALDIYPGDIAECCGWITPRIRLADWVRDGAIDWNRLFNTQQMKFLRLDMLDGGFNLCQKCCPLNPRYNAVWTPHRYGYDRAES